MLTRLFDAHVHLPLSATTVIRHAARRIDGVSVCATDVNSWANVLACGNEQQACLNLGVHPWWSASITATELADRLRPVLTADVALSVGEIGLDKSKRAAERGTYDEQLDVIRAQLRLAGELGRPISVHCVQAHTELAEELEALQSELSSGSSPGPGLAGVLLHSWGGPPAIVNRIQAAVGTATACPVVASIQGSIVITASNAWAQHHRPEAKDNPDALPRGASKHALACVTTLRLDQLAVETDSPDLPFLHLTDPGYRQWAREVLPWPGDELEEEHEHAANGGSADTPHQAVCCDGSAGGAAATPRPNEPANVVHVWRALTLLRADHELDTRTSKERSRGAPRPPSLFSVPDLGTTDDPTWAAVRSRTRDLGVQLAHATRTNTLRVFSAWARSKGLLDEAGQSV